VQLLQGDLLVGKQGEAAYVEMTPVCNPIASVSALRMTGGEYIAFNGGGFVRGAEEYICAWTTAAQEHWNTSVQFINGSKVRCESPDILGATIGTSPNISVTVRLLQRLGVDVRGPNGPSLNIAFIPSWYSAQSLVESELQDMVSAHTGGSLLVITGGFRLVEYRLRFSKESKTVSSADSCEFQTSSRLVCVTPPWDLNAGYALDKVEVSLLANNQAVQFHGREPVLLKITRAYVESIGKDPTTALVSYNSSAYVNAGGDEIFLSGSFPTGTYQCSFMFAEVSSFNTNTTTHVVRTAAKKINSTLVSCLTPRHSHIIMNVSVLQTVSAGSSSVSTSMPQVGVGKSGLKIFLASMIKSVEPKMIAASSDTQLTIIGSDFEYRDFELGSYECVFRLSSGRRTAIAIAINESALVCVAPAIAQYDIAGDIHVHVEKQGSPVMWEDKNEGSAVRYYPEFSLAKNSGFAAAEEVKIIVHGLDYTDGNIYRLIFTAVTDPLKSMVAPVTLYKDDNFLDAFAILRPWPFKSSKKAQVTMEHNYIGGERWQTIKFVGFPAGEAYEFTEVVLDVITERIPDSVCMASASRPCWPAPVVLTTGAVLDDKGDFLCKFVAKTGRTIVSTNVTYMTSGSVICWVEDDVMQHSAHVYAVALFQNGNLIPKSPSSRTSVVFSEGFFKVSPSSLPASGGTRVIVEGFSFVLESTSYVCRFIDRHGQYVQTAAESTNISALVFALPVWPYTASPVRVQILKIAVGAAETEVAFHGVSNSSRMINLTAAWWFEKVPSGSVKGGAGLQPALGHDPRTPLLTFTGVGFDLNALYYAEFSGRDASGTPTSAVSSSSSSLVLSSDRLLLQVPPWSGILGQVNMTLFLCLGGTFSNASDAGAICSVVLKEKGTSIAHPSSKVLNTFFYVGGWDVPLGSETTFVPLAETLFFLGGFASTSADAYVLVISSSRNNASLVRSEGVSEVSSAVNASSVLFVLPEWPYAAGDVLVQFFQGETEIRAGSEAAANVKFRYRETFHNLDPAFGPLFAPILLQGSSFREDVQYVCLLWKASGKLQRIQARFISTTNLSCDTFGDLNGTEEVDVVVAYSNGSADVVVAYSNGSASFARYRFEPSFTSIIPWKAFVSSTTVISVVGHSLEMSEEHSYTCRFSAHGGMQLESEPARAVHLNGFSQLIKCLVHVPSNWTEHKSTMTLVKSSNTLICSNTTSKGCSGRDFLFVGFIKRLNCSATTTGQRSLFFCQPFLSGLSFRQNPIFFEVVGLVLGNSSYSCKFSSATDSRTISTTSTIADNGLLTCLSPIRPVNSSEFVTISRTDGSLVSGITRNFMNFSDQFGLLVAIPQLIADDNPYEFRYVEMSSGVVAPK
jgi:hypothetical protein